MTTQAVSGRRYFTKAWLMEQKSLIALLVLIAIVSTMSPNFFTVNNLFNILQQTSVNAIMAVGMTLVILTSGIDLSVGSLLALTGAVAASIVGIEVNALVVVAAALSLGAAIGAVTGVIVAKGRVQAFIATLVMMLLLRGVTMVYTNGSPVNTGFTDNADLFGWFGIGRPLGIPTPVWIMVSSSWRRGTCCTTRVWAAIFMHWAVTKRQRVCPVSASTKLKLSFTHCAVCWPLWRASSKWRASLPRSQRRVRGMSWMPLRQWFWAVRVLRAVKVALLGH